MSERAGGQVLHPPGSRQLLQVMGYPPEHPNHATLIHTHIIGFRRSLIRPEIHHGSTPSGERLQPFNTGDERSGFLY
jgi:hypothetical protein